MTAQGTYAPEPAAQYEDANGNPAVSYRLFTYLAGTATKVNTYTDIGLSVANANPLTLTSDARPTVMLTPGVSYKFVLALPGIDDPPASTLWTRDNVMAVNPASSSSDLDVTGTAGENLSAGDCVAMSDGSGGGTAGRWYKADADLTNLSSAAEAVGFATAAISSSASGTIRRGGRITGLSGLVAGTKYFVSATAGALTATAPTNARGILMADSTTAGIILTGEPLASATVPGIVGLVSQTLGTGVSTDVKTVGALIINSQATFKQGAASSVDGTMSGVIYRDSVQHANTLTGETTLSTYTLPANALNADGKSVRIVAWGTGPNNANTKTVRIKFGGTTFTAFTLGAAATSTWRAEVVVMRRSATTQVGYEITHVDTGGVSSIRLFTASPGETLSGTVVITSTGQSGTASSDVIQEGFFVEAVG